jgi:Tol biopolymer transport system component/DNA-binding winged helix-turn-helix (wHTH) protein
MVSPNPHPIYEFGGFRLDCGRRLLARVDGERVPLAGKAFDALVHLVEHAGELVPRSVLLDSLWPSTAVEENNLSQVISALRRALGEGFITTVARRGYQFVADVRTISAEPPRDATAPEPPGSPPRPASLPARAPVSGARRAGILALLGFAAALLGLAYWAISRSGEGMGNPLGSATYARLTEFEGAEEHAAISRDGRYVAFLADRDGEWDIWVGEVGTGDLRNVTMGAVNGLRNPAARALALNPDGSLVTTWTKAADPAGGGMVDTAWAASIVGGALRPYLRGVAELDWSPDGRRIVYHTSASGDPLFVAEADNTHARQIHVAPPGIHCHFPLWARDGEHVYFVRGIPPGEMDLWRIRASGNDPERLTFHNSSVSFPTLLDDRTLLYLAAAADGSGPWVHAFDLVRRASRRLNTGVEAYRSLAGSATGRRLVATVSRSASGLWRIPIVDPPGAATATQLRLPTPRGTSPRFAPDGLVYRAPKAGGDGILRLAQGRAIELWSGADGPVVAGPAVSPDGRQIAFSVQRREFTRLHVMNLDGSNVRSIAADLDVRGSPAWSPDGRWIASAAIQGSEPRLFKIPVDGGDAVQLGDRYALDPAWSPSGRLLVHSGADVGARVLISATNVDGTAHELPPIVLSRGSRRLAFLGKHDTLVVLKGSLSHKEPWTIDLDTGIERRLCELDPGAIVTDFDVSPKGREILFDRVRDASDIVLIELP